jgi:glycine/D-amino acid oxidase-like deaminating enzyme
MVKKINLYPQYDQTCGWINCLEPRSAFPKLDRDKKADWTIIGGGYTGLSFARRMAELRPEVKIIVVDSGAIGEGASARNSGFAVANSSSGGAFDPSKLEEYKRINRINSAGIDLLRNTVEKHNIDCQWRDVGKLNCGAEHATNKEADHLIDWLNASDTEYEDLSGADLAQRLGTSYYQRGIWTKGDVLIQPAALARGLSRSLPDNVDLYDHSPVTAIAEQGGGITLQTPEARIVTDQLMLATNGFLHAMTPQPSYTIPLTLTSSLTRVLTKTEQSAMGNPKDWGVLSLHPMGATLRYTQDHRILIRNTAAYKANAYHTDSEMLHARKKHLACLRQRFAALGDLGLEHSWQGVLCVSRNSTSLFGRLSKKIVVAGCYNASGVSRGTAFGHALAEYAEAGDSKLINDINKYPKPKWMPPRPILDMAMKSVIQCRMINMGLDR